MKTSITTAAVLATLVVTNCSVGYCGGPLARLMRCNSTRTCAPVTSCSNGTSSESSAMMDQPSELNIMLTTELVALRKQVEDMTVAAADKDAAIEEVNALVSKLRDESKKQNAKISRESKRADLAEAELVRVQDNAVKAAEDSRLAAAKTTEQVKKLTKQNAGLKKRMQKASSDLKKADQALKQEKEKRKEDDRRSQENAIETPPVAAKDEDAAGAADTP